MTLADLLPLIIGFIAGIFIAKGMVWMVVKAKSQQNGTTKIFKSPDGSLNIQAGGDINIGTKRKGGHQGRLTEEAVLFDRTVEVADEAVEAVDLKRNSLDG